MKRVQSSLRPSLRTLERLHERARLLADRNIWFTEAGRSSAPAIDRLRLH